MNRLFFAVPPMLAACGGVVSAPGSTSTGTGGTMSTSSVASTTGTGGTSSTTSTSTSTGTVPGVCVVGQDQTCNDELSVSAIWGKCQPDGSCTCNPGFEINPSTGHCRPIMDGGPASCGGVSCADNEFCVKRVHSQDGGPVPPTWMCQVYFMCMDHTCACAIQNFVSASCVNPTCVTESPVVLTCDDLN